MLDAYGLPLSTRQQQERRLTMARSGYEASCSRQGIAADWSLLDADTRYLWLMTADALLDREHQVAVPLTTRVQ